MNDFTGEREGYYASDDKPVPEEWKKKPRSGWPGKVMVCMGISWNGTTSLYFVPPKAKMNGRMFIDLVLKPMFKRDIPRLYPGEEKKIILHMDSAGAHVKDTVVEWLQDQKIRFITKEEWMANSPDLSPMDYGVNSIFKRRCNKHKAQDMDQLVAIAKREWKKFGVGHCRNILKTWPERVKRMIEMSGYQIENTF